MSLVVEILFEVLRRFLKGNVLGVLILLTSLKSFPVAGEEIKEEVKVRTADSCATVAELNDLRHDTVAVADATLRAVVGINKQLKRHEKAIDGIFEILKMQTGSK